MNQIEWGVGKERETGRDINKKAWVERQWVPTCAESFSGFHSLWGKILPTARSCPCPPSSVTAPNIALQIKHDTDICDSQNIPGSSCLYMSCSSGEKMSLQTCLHIEYQSAFRNLEQMLGRDPGQIYCGRGMRGEGKEEQGKDNMAQINGIWNSTAGPRLTNLVQCCYVITLMRCLRNLTLVFIN